MSRLEYRFDNPDRVVIGTIGQPGERAFYLQVREGTRLCSVLLEKQQAAVLADAIEEILTESMLLQDISAAVVGADVRPLDVPLTEEFRVMRLTLSWQPMDRRIRLEAMSTEEPTDTDEVDDNLAMSAEQEPVQVLSVAISPEYAQEFMRRTRAVVAAGRRACPVCERPLDPSGHVCPRANGYHRLEQR